MAFRSRGFEITSAASSGSMMVTADGATRITCRASASKRSRCSLLCPPSTSVAVYRIPITDVRVATSKWIMFESFLETLGGHSPRLGTRAGGVKLRSNSSPGGPTITRFSWRTDPLHDSSGPLTAGTAAFASRNFRVRKSAFMPVEPVISARGDAPRAKCPTWASWRYGCGIEPRESARCSGVLQGVACVDSKRRGKDRARWKGAFLRRSCRSLPDFEACRIRVEAEGSGGRFGAGPYRGLRSGAPWGGAARFPLDRSGSRDRISGCLKSQNGNSRRG